MSKTKIYKVKVEWGDCDPAGIVFYPNFYRWMDAAQWNYFEKLKYPIKTLQKKYKIIGLPLVYTDAKYLIPCYRDDILTIKTNLVKISNSTIKLQHLIINNNKTACIGSETRIWAKNSSGKITSAPIPNDVKKIFQLNLSKEIIN